MKLTEYLHRARLAGFLLGALLSFLPLAVQSQDPPQAPALGSWTPSADGSVTSSPTSAGDGLAASPGATVQGSVPDLCSLLPSGGELGGTELDSADGVVGILAKCIGTYPTGSLVIFLFDDVSKAEKEVSVIDTYRERSGYIVIPRTDLGERGVELRLEQSPPGNPDSPVLYQLHFRRGCFTVGGFAGGILFNYIMDAAGQAEWAQRQQWAQTAVAEVDGRLREALNTIPPCPGALPPPAATTEAPGALGVSLTCQHEFDDSGLVMCTAAPYNQRNDAAIAYEWAFDGSTQSDVTGEELTLTGVEPGDHTVTVVARDDVNQLVSSPQSVTFTKGGVGGESSAGPFVPVDDDDGPPVLPILLATGIAVLGAAALRARAHRRKVASVPSSSESPGRAPSPDVPTDAMPRGTPRRPPPTRPPETGLAGSPTAAPTASRPARPQPPETAVRPAATTTATRPKPPRPSRPPETAGAATPTPVSRTATAARPAATPPRTDGRRDRKRKEGEVWLEADKPSVTVKGDGKDRVEFDVSARKLVNGMPTDASNEVWMHIKPAPDRKIFTSTASVTAGVHRVVVRATHAGSVPLHGSVTVDATRVGSGTPVPPIVIAVEVRAVKLEVELRAWKKGFNEQKISATLPSSCERIRGRVEGGERVIGPMPEGFSERRGVVHAHCSARLRVGDGNWSSPVEVRTEEGGSFWFRLPPRLVQQFGADMPAFDVPQVLDLGLNDEAKYSLKTYNQALADFQSQTHDVESGTAYGRARDDCADYASVFIKQLRERQEDDYPRLLSAINCLRCSIRFSLKSRRDFKYQRYLVNMAGNDVFGAAFDVITDFVPVAGWILGEPLKLGGREYRSLPELARSFAGYVATTRVGRWAAGAMLRVVAPLLRYLKEAIQELFTRLADLAREALVPVGLTKMLAQQAADTTGVDVARVLPSDRSLASEAAELATRCIEVPIRLFELCVRGFFGLIHLLVLLFVSGVKMLGKKIRELLAEVPFDEPLEGGKSTLGEVIEQYLGGWSDGFYEAFFTPLERWFRQLLGVPAPAVATGGADEPPRSLLSRLANPGTLVQDFASALMDTLVDLKDLDNRSAQALLEAHQRSMNLDVDEEWQPIVTKVSQQEIEQMNRWQSASEAVAFVDSAAPFIKFAVKLVQMFVFASVAVGEMAIRQLARVAESVASAGAAGTDGEGLDDAAKKRKTSLDRTGAFEKYMDVLELAIVRIPILLKELIALVCGYFTAPSRIRALYPPVVDQGIQSRDVLGGA